MSYHFLAYEEDHTFEDVNCPFSFSGKEAVSNDVMMQCEEFSNVHNNDRASTAIRSSLAYKIV